MALDLSGVSEDPFTTANTNAAVTLPKYVVLSSEVVAIPGTNDILFYISDVGQLILANFLIEHVSGTHYLKKSTCPNQVVDKLPDSPTNLCLDKPHLNGNNDHGSHSDHHQLQQQHQSNCTQIKASDGLQCYGSIQANSLNNSESYSTLPHDTQNCFAIQEASDQPVDATLPRQQFDLHPTIDNLPNEIDVDKEDETNQTSSILSQWVRHLLDDPKYAHDSANRDIIVHGHNLSEISRFVKRLRQFRLQMGLSQNQLGSQLSKHFNYKTVFSQTLLSRFEKLNVTLRAACRLMPYLDSWMSHTQTRDGLANPSHTSTTSDGLSSRVIAVGKARRNALTRLGQSIDTITIEQNPSSNDSNTDAVESDTLCQQTTLPESLVQKSDSPSVELKILNTPQRRPRRKRTYFSSKALNILMTEYAQNPRPSSSDFSRLATETGHDRESVRIWFCNRRVHDSGVHQRKS